jgi:hypothetical protein
MKVTDNRGDSGWYKKEILESTESWSNDRENYKVEYLMDDGDLVQGHLGLKEWFDNTQAA